MQIEGWRDHVNKDAEKQGAQNWKAMVQDTQRWSKLIKRAKVCKTTKIFKKEKPISLKKYLLKFLIDAQKFCFHISILMRDFLVEISKW